MDLKEIRISVPHIARRHPWELARAGVVHRLLQSGLRGRVPKLVLDVGCGDAFLAEQLAQRFPGTQFLGIDAAFDEELLDSLRPQLQDKGIRLYRTLDDAAAQHTGPADVVLLLDVLEHVEDDIGFLQSLRSSGMVAAETLFIVTVPAFQGLFSSHDVCLGHYRRYNNALLADHLTRAGFETDALGYFFFSLLAPRRLQVWREAKAAHKQPEWTGVAGWQGGRWTTGLLRRLLLMDFAASQALRKVGVRIPGLSNYALCRPSASLCPVTMSSDG